jgi:hypothetical protein
MAELAVVISALSLVVAIAQFVGQVIEAVHGRRREKTTKD